MGRNINHVNRSWVCPEVFGTVYVGYEEAKGVGNYSGFSKH